MNRRGLFKLAGKVGLVSLASQVPWSWLEQAGLVGEYLAEAAALPRNYAVSAGTQLTDTSTGTAGLAVSGLEAGSATWSLSEVTTPSYLRPRLPSQPSRVLKLQATSAVGGSYKTEWAVSVKPKDISHFWFLVFAENLAGLTNNASILFSDTGAYANRYSYGYSFTADNEGLWRDVRIPFSALSVAGGAPDVNATFTRLRLVFGAAVGAMPTYYICPVWINRASKPVFTLSFDDKDANDYTNAYAYMQPRGIPGSLAITSGSGTLSVANMQTMQTNGWSIHNHTHSHPSLPSLTDAQIADELGTCRDYMAANGINSGRSAMVFPFGATDARVNAVVAQYYPYAFITGSASAINPLFDGIQNPYFTSRSVMDVPTTANQLTTNIASAINQGVGMNLFGHSVRSGAGTGFTDLATLQTVVNVLTRLRDANVIDIRNMEDMLTGLVNPRRRRPS